jgi:cell division protein FtsI (penicillin-binding protein 3)
MVRRTISSATAATLTTMMEGVVERGTATAAQLEGYQVAGKTGTAHKAMGGRYSATDYYASFVGFVPSRKPAFTILVVVDTPRGGTYYGGTVAAPIFKAIAAAALQHAGVPSSINPVPPVIIQAQPELPARTRVSTPMVVPAGGVAVMPDVRGLAAREATRLLSGVGLNVSMNGSGVVARQSPEPGTPVPASGRALLILDRRPTEVAW